MKKLITIFLGGLIFTSCNNKDTSTNEVVKDTSATTEVSTQKMNYPYTIDHPDNWETGSSENTMNVLSGLKAYENGNIEETIKYFGDSVQIRFDGLDKKVSSDTLKAMFTRSRGGLKSMSIKMEDWESVISKDKKDEYVTLWYREYWEDMKGNKDSAAMVNDFKMKNGKILELDQYTREYH
ncbi:MAG: hypothetical protein ABI290_08345 [Ginsengibacter sp.]